jgi:hypothetical protein
VSCPDDISGTHNGGYRRDCSGYASMALGLPGPGLDAAGLGDRYPPIPKQQLLPGDLLINPAPSGAGHVVIFDHWTDPTMSAYLGYEQSGDGGTTASSLIHMGRLCALAVLCGALTSEEPTWLRANITGGWDPVPVDGASTSGCPPSGRAARFASPLQEYLVVVGRERAGRVRARATHNGSDHRRHRARRGRLPQR